MVYFIIYWSIVVHLIGKSHICSIGKICIEIVTLKIGLGKRGYLSNKYLIFNINYLVIITETLFLKLY